jgi:hypothetical protein
MRKALAHTHMYTHTHTHARFTPETHPIDAQLFGARAGGNDLRGVKGGKEEAVSSVRCSQ